MDKYTLKTARDRVGLSQQDAAERLGISQKTLSNYESGVTFPDAMTILMIQDVYDVTFDQLLFRPNVTQERNA